MVLARSEAQGAIQFQYLAEIAVGTSARIDLCRASSPPHLAGRLLAVKRLHQHIAEDPSFANQFLDEVWMTASLKHPNVVEVAGWGNDDEGMYLAVELVQGVSLARLMKTIFDTGEAFTERMVVYIASRLCRGLAAAHGLRAQNGELLQLVHRDLTPSNVLVGFNGDLKIADFGLAKAKQRLTKTLTGLLKGQPQYMAPEQARGDNIDHRTDLFALGVMMFELFTRRKPWLAASDFDAVQAILSRPPDDLQKLRPKIDKELASVVHRCLEKDPAARFQSANEIQARLDEWLLVHGYQEGNEDALGRFVRRNAMRQMRWFERAIAGDLIEGRPEPPKISEFTGQNPPVQFKGGNDDGEETDVTDVESLVSEMQQRSSDPATARRMVEEQDFSEEVPTIVHKSGSVPFRAKGGPAPGPAARLARPLPTGPQGAPGFNTPGPPGARPPSGAPPRPPGRPPGPSPAARGAPPPPAAGNPAIPVVARSGPAAAAPRGQMAAIRPSGASARPFGASEAAPTTAPRGMHESIIDEESDARTTAVKARPRTMPRGQAPVILPPFRPSSPSISDAESEEVPTLPLQGVPPSMRTGRGSGGGSDAPPVGAPSRSAPGHIAPHDPRVPGPPAAAQGFQSLQGVEEERSGGRLPITEDRLFAEADRLALEAVRFSDEAKLSAARAERQAVIAKIAGDAAAIAVEAVRLATTGGFGEAARRLEDSYALEQTIRRLVAAPLDVAPSAMHAAMQRGTTAPLPAKSPPSSSPGLGPPREPQPSYAPPPMSSGAPPSHGGGGGTIPMSMRRPDSNSMMPPPPTAQGTGAFDAFEERLRPTIFGLPSVHVAALAIGTFVLVLILMWILMG